MLKGDVFSKQLFENQIFALFINTFLNGNNGVASGYKNDMALSYSGGNVTIASGAICIQGRFLEEATTTTLSVGQTSKYHKLVVEIDLDKTNTEQSFEQGYYKILSASGSYPSVTQTDIVKNVSGIYQYELARFQTDSSGNITNWTDKREFLDIESIYTAIETATTSLLNTIQGNANDLITDLRNEIASVEDGSAYVINTLYERQIADGNTFTGHQSAFGRIGHISGTVHANAGAPYTDFSISIPSYNSPYNPNHSEKMKYSIVLDYQVNGVTYHATFDIELMIYQGMFEGRILTKTDDEDYHSYSVDIPINFTYITEYLTE